MNTIEDKIKKIGENIAYLEEKGIVSLNKMIQSQPGRFLVHKDDMIRLYVEHVEILIKNGFDPILISADEIYKLNYKKNLVEFAFFEWYYSYKTKSDREKIGQRIKQLREESGLTQDDLAEKTGLLKQNISRIESGKYSTGQDILSKIAAALGKKLDIV